MHTAWHVGLFVLLTASAALGLYEEQAGENDWHSEFVGQVIDAQPSTKDRFVVSTTSNVLASLSVDTGAIVWRQVLHNSDQLQRFTVTSKPAAVISLSSSGSILRAWRADDGALLWEKYLNTSSQNTDATVSLIPEATLGSGEGIAVVIEGSIKVRISPQTHLACSYATHSLDGHSLSQIITGVLNS